MNFLPDSEIVNLKYQLAQQIKASINRAASSKSSNTPFLESSVDILVDELAELKIEISKLSLNLSSIQNEEKNYSSSSSSMNNKSTDYSTKNKTSNENGVLTFPIRLTPDDLQNIDNFYYPETAENNNTYIWIGPENKTSIELPVNLAFPIKLIIKNVRFITEAIKDSLEIFVNGEQLEFELFRNDDGDAITAVWLPLHNSIKDKCVIDICVDESISVKDIYPEASDARKLCMALKEIEIHNNSLEYVNT